VRLHGSRAERRHEAAGRRRGKLDPKAVPADRCGWVEVREGSRWPRSTRSICLERVTREGDPRSSRMSCPGATEQSSSPALAKAARTTAC
jgi:hypothetical protein